MCVVHLSHMCLRFFFFFFNDTATTEIYTLSLHDALPICHLSLGVLAQFFYVGAQVGVASFIIRFAEHTLPGLSEDRKSTRLNSSHLVISYAVFCLKKKNNLVAFIKLMLFVSLLDCVILS